MQASNKNESRVVILSGNHMRECTKRINNYMSAKFRTIGWIKPGVVAKEVYIKAV
jgi:hypothetical protein